MTRVLLVDDEKDFRLSLAEALRLIEFDVSECASGEEAISRLQQKPFDVILTDLHIPGVSGMELLREVGTRTPTAVVFVITAHGSIENAVEAIRHGARDYLVKPVPIETVLDKIGRFLQPRKALNDDRDPRTVDQTGRFPTGLVGRSRAMHDLEQVILKAGPADSTVLIQGETGTGKELVAHALHRAGSRRDRPFVAVNCSAIPGSLLESQLFGHIRGAFTGADRDRQGLLELARNGTLFLDEIGEMPLSLQPKLLRALDAREFLPVGSTVALPVFARVVAATNRDLKAMAESGQFRQDLYFRLSTLEIPIAPLRARLEDVDVTAHHLIARISRTMGRATPALSPPALSALEHHHWPGNVRELANVLERAMILNHGQTIEPHDFPGFLNSGSLPSGSTLQAARKSFEQMLIKRAIDMSGGDKVRAARMLGINLTSLYRKLSPLSRMPHPTSD